MAGSWGAGTEASGRGLWTDVGRTTGRVAGGSCGADRVGEGAATLAGSEVSGTGPGDDTSHALNTRHKAVTPSASHTSQVPWPVRFFWIRVTPSRST
ncbi:hypothetical protein [Archangium sp.]|uniref:hypothetical protein n=1 Tax=Archangium sp. TaxID=1872627 RepID=UPI002ED8A4AE